MTFKVAPVPLSFYSQCLRNFNPQSDNIIQNRNYLVLGQVPGKTFEDNKIIWAISKYGCTIACLSSVLNLHCCTLLQALKAYHPSLLNMILPNWLKPITANLRMQSSGISQLQYPIIYCQWCVMHKSSHQVATTTCTIIFIMVTKTSGF